MSFLGMAGGLGSGVVKLGSNAVKSGAGGINWGQLAGDLGKSSGFWNNVGSAVSGLLGGGSSGGKNDLTSNIFAAMLGGINGSADAKLAVEMTERKARIEGDENRKTSAFEAELADFYRQKDKTRKRAALDTYGQFSLMNRYAPNRTAAPGIQMPAKPTATGYKG